MLFIDKEKVSNLLTMNECIEIIHDLFLNKQNKTIINPLRLIMGLPQNVGLLGMMPAYLESMGIMGIKVLSVFHENYKKGLSSHQGAILLFETTTGKLLAIIDAEEITSIRTPAVSGLMTKLLSRTNSSHLCLLGTGKQAEGHLEAIKLVRQINKVTVWSNDLSRSKQFVDQQSKKYDIEFIVKDTAQSAVENADIVCTLTPSVNPILKYDWIKPGVHINAVGACSPNARELESDIVINSKLYIDNHESALNESGDILFPIKEGKINSNHIIGDINELLNNKIQGRMDDQELTLFKSLGIAAEDVATAYFVYQKYHIKTTS